MIPHCTSWLEVRSCEVEVVKLNGKEDRDGNQKQIGNFLLPGFHLLKFFQVEQFNYASELFEKNMQWFFTLFRMEKELKQRRKRKICN